MLRGFSGEAAKANCLPQGPVQTPRKGKRLGHFHGAGTTARRCADKARGYATSPQALAPTTLFELVVHFLREGRASTV